MAMQSIARSSRTSGSAHASRSTTSSNSASVRSATADPGLYCRSRPRPFCTGAPLAAAQSWHYGMLPMKISYSAALKEPKLGVAAVLFCATANHPPAWCTRVCAAESLGAARAMLRSTAPTSRERRGAPRQSWCRSCRPRWCLTRPSGSTSHPQQRSTGRDTQSPCRRRPADGTSTGLPSAPRGYQLKLGGAADMTPRPFSPPGSAENPSYLDYAAPSADAPHKIIKSLLVLAHRNEGAR